MNTTQTIRSLVIVLAMGFIVRHAAYCQQSLSGRVYDYKLSTATNLVGIPGVTVSILQDGSKIKEQATGLNGSYAFDDLPSNTSLNIRFELAGYLKHPTIKPLKLEAAASVMDIYLLKQTDARSSLIADRLKERLTRKEATLISEMAVLDEFGQELLTQETLFAALNPKEIPSAGNPGGERIAVINFENHARSQWWETGGSAASQKYFETELAKSGTFQVVKLTSLKNLKIDEHPAGSGTIDPAAAIRIGGALGVGYLLTGSLTEYGAAGQGTAGTAGKFNAGVSAQLIDTSTGKIVWSDSARRAASTQHVSSGNIDIKMFDQVMKPTILELIPDIAAAATAKKQ